jgi:hypothetical protein
MAPMAERHWEAAGEFRAVAPSARTIRNLMLLLAVLGVFGGLITLLGLARGGIALVSNRALGYGLVLLLTAGLLFVGLSLWSANVRLLIGRGTVGYRDIFRRSRFWSHGEIDRIIDMAIIYGRSSQPQRGFYLFDLNGKRLLVLSQRAWPAKDLTDFIGATGVHVDYRDAPVPVKEISREFPNAFGWGARHVMMATVMTMAAATAFAIVGYVVVSATFLR